MSGGNEYPVGPGQPRHGAEADRPALPGWYPNPTGDIGKLYWDGQQWHTTIPAAHRRGGPVVKAVAVAGMALSSVAGLGAIGSALWWAAGNHGGPTASNTLPQTAPTPTTPGYLSQKTMPTDGVYLVGGDQVDPGIWESPGPAPTSAGHCRWARLSAPQQTPETTLQAGGSDSGPAQVRILPTDAAFATQGCQPWHPVGK